MKTKTEIDFLKLAKKYNKEIAIRGVHPFTTKEMHDLLISLGFNYIAFLYKYLLANAYIYVRDSRKNHYRVSFHQKQLTRPLIEELYNNYRKHYRDSDAKRKGKEITPEAPVTEIVTIEVAHEINPIEARLQDVKTFITSILSNKNYVIEVGDMDLNSLLKGFGFSVKEQVLHEVTF